jgi:hypothetical protein
VPTGYDFQFTTPVASLDRRNNRSMIGEGRTSMLYGADGRFSGAIRRFPGFKKLRQLTPEAGKTYDEVYFFQPFSIQKGNTTEYLRGFVVYGKYDTTSYTARLHYYDQNAGSWDATNIETGLSAGETISIAENGKTLYYARLGGTAQSIFWSGTAGGGSISIEDMGPGDFGTGDTALTAPTAAQYDDGGGTDYSGMLDIGTYLIGYRLRDTDRGVYSGVSPLTEVETDADGVSIVVTGTFAEATTNIEDFDTVEVFRTISAEVAGDTYAGGVLYKCGEALLVDGGANRTFTYVAGLDTSGGSLPGVLPTYYDELRDNQLVQQIIVDPIAEYAAAPPDSGVVAFYQGVTFMAGTNSTGAADARTRLQWSPVESRNPENFPPLNSAYVDSVLGELVALVNAGDSLFGFSPNGSLRITRVGPRHSFYTLHTGRGPVSKNAITAVDNSIFFVSPNEALYMDASSATLTSVGALGRVITDEWSGTLDSVSCCYDASLGAIVTLNDDLDEAVLIWSSNNSVSQLGDLPFVLCGSGIDPEVSGTGTNSLRGFYIMNDGRVYYANADADTTGISLTTLGLSGTVRGSCTVTGTTVTIVGSANTDAIGGYIYLTDGSPTGNRAAYARRKVTNATGSAYTIDSAVSDQTPTQYELSPVPMKVRYWPLAWNSLPADVRQAYPRYMFRRIKAKSMQVLSSDSSLPTGAKWVAGVYRNFEDTKDKEVMISVDTDPSDSVGYIPCDAHVFEPGIDLFVAGGIVELVALNVQLAVSGSKNIGEL